MSAKRARRGFHTEGGHVTFTIFRDVEERGRSEVEEVHCITGVSLYILNISIGRIISATFKTVSRGMKLQKHGFLGNLIWAVGNAALGFDNLQSTIDA